MLAANSPVSPVWPLPPPPPNFFFFNKNSTDQLHVERIRVAFMAKTVPNPFPARRAALYSTELCFLHFKGTH